ncbi:MAG: hypothetical protein C4K60_17015 [Ideonella sp. MAG2]|nr:MAG: hypothetical protein C4K60_17015 [Ideonella sp. MAG2]
MVGQGVVDGGFDLAAKAKFDVVAHLVKASVDVVAQHAVVPAGKGGFAFEMLVHRIAVGPLVTAFL